MQTPRLLIKPLLLRNVSAVTRLAGHPLIADTTLLIPYPYLPSHARRFILASRRSRSKGREAVFGIFHKRQDLLLGIIGLTIDGAHHTAEMGYWVGVPYWGKGYATEAARRIVRHGFEDLNLHKVWARYFKRNPASGRVLQKLGFHCEGCQRRHVLKNGRHEDVVLCGILQEEWKKEK